MARLVYMTNTASKTVFEKMADSNLNLVRREGLSMIGFGPGRGNAVLRYADGSYEVAFGPYEARQTVSGVRKVVRAKLAEIIAEANA